MARIYIPGSIFSLLVQVASEGKVAPNYVVVDTDYTGYAIVYSCSEVWASARGTAACSLYSEVQRVPCTVCVF